MSEEVNDTNEIERGDLLSKIEELNSKIRQKILALVAHPGVPQRFKDHPVVKKAIK